MCKFKLFSIAAAALMMVACSTEDLTQQTQIKTGEMHFTATIAAPSSGATTRTIYTEDTQNKKITVAWKVGDEIALVHNKVKDVATVKTINADGSATITGYVTGATNNADVRLYYPAARISGVTSDGNPVFDGSVEGKISSQDGTLKYIQDNLDFREGKGNLSVNGTEVTLKEPVKMAADNAIWKLTLSDGTNNLSATQVKIKGGTSVLASTTTLTAGTSVVTLAIPTNVVIVGALTIEATVSDDTYAYTKAEGPMFNSGTYYQSTVTMTMQAPTLDTPLTFKALTAGTIVVSNPQSGMQYSLNGGEKTAVTSAITVEAGQKVAFFGTADQYSGTKFGGTAEVKVYGNIMSLLYADFADKKSLSDVQDDTFKQLFENNIGLKDASGLLLPATTLINSCYYSMFKGCTGLTAAPKELPATSLENNCYYYMFSGCISLTTVPEELPATTLKSYCYNNMFSGCTSLTATPKLPATTLGDGCYVSMFSGCTSLTKAYVKAAFSSLNCGNMFKSCTNASTSTFYSDNAAGWISAFPNNLGDWQAEAYPLTYPVALSAVTSDYVGSVVTTDGNVYATAKDATDAGKTAVAKICYVGDNGEAAPNNHGLALALTDESSTMQWEAAKTACNTTKNTSIPVTNAKWLLASKDQWNNMITAAGGYTALRDGFSGIAGASNLQSNFYWSSTEDDSNNANAWLYRFSNGQWYHDSKGYGDIRVRACLAF